MKERNKERKEETKKERKEQRKKGRNKERKEGRKKKKRKNKILFYKNHTKIYGFKHLDGKGIIASSSLH